MLLYESWLLFQMLSAKRRCSSFAVRFYCFFLFVFVPFNIFALLAPAPSSSRNSDPGSRSRLFSPLPNTFRVLCFYREIVSGFPPRRLVSNCVLIKHPSNSICESYTPRTDEADRDVGYLVPRLPLWGFVQDLHHTGPTQQLCARSYALYRSHPATTWATYVDHTRSGIYLPCLADLDHELYWE